MSDYCKCNKTKRRPQMSAGQATISVAEVARSHTSSSIGLHPHLHLHCCCVFSLQPSVKQQGQHCHILFGFPICEVFFRASGVIFLACSAMLTIAVCTYRLVTTNVCCCCRKWNHPSFCQKLFSLERHRGSLTDPHWFGPDSLQKTFVLFFRQ